jgi:hypothetical protein
MLGISIPYTRFSSVSDRFITEIGRGGANLKEIKLEMLVWAMRFLKLQVAIIII